MRNLFISCALTFCLLVVSCGGSSSTSAPENSSSTAASTQSGSGNISCKLDGKDWSNNKAEATQTGKSFLNIASDENQKEAISIIIDHPAAGTFNFNRGVNGSYTDASGASFGSSDATGTVIVTNYIAPADKSDGKVEGTFSGTFKFDPTKQHVITEGKFSMPVKKL